MNGEEAATNCQTQFGSFGPGRLFEPQDVATNDQVVAEVAAADSGIFYMALPVVEFQYQRYKIRKSLNFENWTNGERQ